MLPTTAIAIAIALLGPLLGFGVAALPSPRDIPDPGVSPVQIKWPMTTSAAGSPLCLTVQSGYTAYGTNVEFSLCFSTQDKQISPFQAWDISAALDTSPGPITVPVGSSAAGEVACLQADGEGEGDGATLSVQRCDPAQAGQGWRVDREAGVVQRGGVEGQWQCLDVKKDSQGDVRRKPYGWYKDAQTWQCYPGSEQQTFVFSGYSEQ